MSSKPILFNTEMVKAILEGRKNQTRRIVANKILNEIRKNDCYIHNGQIYGTCMCQGDPDGSGGYEVDRWEEIYTQSYSQYKVGDVLYVREPCKIMTLKGCHTDKSLILVYKYRNDITNIEYKIKLPDRFYKKDNVVPDWVSWFGKTMIPSGSIKEMARIFLKVTSVRVERLQDMNMYEETGSLNIFKHKKYYDNWNSTAKDGYKWEDNPYVFVYEFERIEKQ